jgi:hypothetical protein
MIGIVLAALAMFFWGMLYWGFSPLPYTGWKRIADDEAAQRALKQYFPETGTYYIPGMYNEPALLERLHSQGPVGFVHITARDGRPLQDVAVMGKGLGLYLAAAMLFLLRMAGAAAFAYGQRVRLVAAAALLAVLMIHVGDTVWWFLPVNWKMFQLVYDLLALIIGGAVLARFGPVRTYPGQA